jgi:hypothetical protein
MEFVLALVVLALVTLIGHGIWMLLAALVRALTGGPRRPPRTAQPIECPGCGRLLPDPMHRCEWCGMDLAGPAAAELTDLEATARQLERFRTGKVLDRSLLERLQDAIRTRRRLLTGATPREEPIPDWPVRRPVAQPERLVPSSESRREAEEILDVIPVAEPEAPARGVPSTQYPVPSTEPVPLPPVPAAPPPPPLAPSPPRGVVPSPVPGRPRRSALDLLAAFMEERNILWGELVGGLLIVGCSLALAIHLWRTQPENPYLPLSLFVTIAGALFALGLYSLHYWKLEFTSRGLLVDATLMVPLVFGFVASLLAASLYSDSSPPPLALVLLIVGAVLALFTWLIFLAGRVLAFDGRWLLPLAVMGGSASQVLMPLYLVPEPGRLAAWRIVLFGSLPVACYVLSVGGLLGLTRRRGPVEESQAKAVLIFLGLTTFALGAALRFQVVYLGLAGVLETALELLAVPVAVAGLPILATGLLVHRALTFSRDAPAEGGSQNAERGALRTVGTGVALAGMLVMLAAGVLAWPAPLAIFLVCAMDFAVLTVVAFRYQLPVAHAAALPCLVAGYLIAFPLYGGQAAGVAHEQLADYLLRGAVSAESGMVLVALAVALLAVAEFLARALPVRPDRIFYAAGSGAVALLSLVIVTGHGAEHLGLATGVYGLYGAGTLAANIRWRRPVLSHVGAALLLGAVLWGQHWLELPHPWLTAFLGHATLIVLASLVIRDRYFAEPSRWSAFVSSLLALPMLFWLTFAFRSLPAPSEVRLLSLYTAWLAAIWLGIAWVKRWRPLFMAFQIALAMAVLFGVTARLAHYDWFRVAYASGFLDPWSLQAHGIGLGGLSLLWVAVRITRNRLGHLRPDWSATARELLAPALDRLVLAGLVLGQFALAVWGIVPDIVRELTPAGMEPDIGPWPLAHVHAYGTGAWLLLGTLTLVLLAALWERVQTGVVLGLVVLAITVPVLAAGPFGSELATASALRWGLGLCFLACSALIWLRIPLGRLAGNLGCPLESASDLPRLSRVVLLLGAAGPILVLTSIVAGVGFSGAFPAGPRADSFFGRVGWIAANVVPMGMVGLGLVGHALRERSPGYAFAAGLVVNVTVMGGYALGIVTSGERFDIAEGVQVVQLSSITAAVWAIAWLTSRRWVGAWREGPDAPLAGPLMTVQLGMSLAGNACLLVAALGLLILLLPYRVAWVIETGSPLGWLAFVLAIAAVGQRLVQRRAPAWPDVVAETRLAMAAGGVGLAMLGLLACCVERELPDWGYRALMLGWGGYTLFAAVVSWRLTEVRARRGVPSSDTPARSASEGTASLAPRAGEASSLGLRQAAAVWVPISGALTVLLGLQATAVHDHLWAAAAITLAGAGGAVMAVWRRKEAWAFAATLGVTLATSLVVWHAHLGMPLSTWWVPLLQANVSTMAVATIAWLWARQRLYGGFDLRPTAGPLLALQATFGLAGNVVLLGVPVTLLLLFPGLFADRHFHVREGSAWIAQAGQVGGWFALVLGMTAAGWHIRQATLRNSVHIVCALAVGVGVLAACVASRWDHGDWLAYHVLTAAWTVTATAILASRVVKAPATVRPIQPWVNGLGAAVVLLAIRGAWNDPHRPYWSAPATLVFSGLFAVLAVWSRWPRPGTAGNGEPDLSAAAMKAARSVRPVYVDVSGLLINMTGILLWLAWGPGTLDSFVCTNVLCLAVAAGLWLLLELALRARTTPVDLRGLGLPFTHVAIVVALCALTLRVAVAVISSMAEGGLSLDDSLAWPALGATAVAVTLCLWDREAGFALGGLYTLGLQAIGLALHGSNLSPPWFGWTAGLVLAAYVLLTAATATVAPRWTDLWRTLRLPGRSAAWPEAWFVPAQAVVAVLVLVLSVWMAIAFDRPAERLAGPLAVALLIPAGVLLAEARSVRVHYAVLTLGVVALTEVCWAMLDPTDPAPWLHRSVLLTAALALMAGVYGVGLVRLLGPQTAWGACSQRMGPLLGVAATGMVLLVLLQEGLLYNPATRSAPVALWAVALVAAALLVLIGAGVVFAVLPGRDPLGLSERGRTLYIYAGEVLLVLLFVHLKLTLPHLFAGQLAAYWPFVVMAIAFAGVGASELCRRRGLRVVAEPLHHTALFLPLLPLLAFWLLPIHDYGPYARDFGHYAVLWFLLGGLYTVVALTRRSLAFAVLAALVANFGLWSVLHDNQVSFLAHPQMWLIPLAIIALVSEHLNRDRLSPAQSTTVRYLALIVIYVSSTADMFIAGIGNSTVLPIVLAVLAVLGVLAGMLLRVQAFLLLGVLFLVLDIATMIWHAAIGQRQMWILWAAGIVLGAAILTLFALFEKRRNEMLHLLEEFKRWE